MNKYLKFVISLPNIIYFNFRYLPFRQAIFLPFFISYKTKSSIKGKIIIEDIQTGIFRMGFHEVPVCNYNDETFIKIDGVLRCTGRVVVGNGTKIRVCDTGELKLGNNFHISASSTINCYKKIEIEDDVLIGWDCLLMDSDAHPIYDVNGKICNYDSSIRIEKHCWICSKSIILKGTVIPNDCVVGACSLVVKNTFNPFSIIAGHPAKSVKTIGGWKEVLPDFHINHNDEKVF